MIRTTVLAMATAGLVFLVQAADGRGPGGGGGGGGSGGRGGSPGGSSSPGGGFRPSSGFAPGGSSTPFRSSGGTPSQGFSGIVPSGSLGSGFSGGSFSSPAGKTVTGTNFGPGGKTNPGGPGFPNGQKGGGPHGPGHGNTVNAWQNNVNHSWRHCNFRNFCPWGGFVFFPTFGDFFGAAYYNWCWEINADQWFFGPHIQQPAGEFSARIHIILPDPNATVWWDDYRTTSTGTTRFCASSPMPLGTTYHFHLKVTWQDSEGTVTMERSVPVQAGAQRIVDFTKSSSLSK